MEKKAVEVFLTAINLFLLVGETRSQCSGVNCKSVTRDNILPDHSLAHVYRTITKTDKDEGSLCLLYCSLDCQCLSVNENENICELNNEDHLTAPWNLRPAPGKTYYSLKISSENDKKCNSCDTCCPKSPCQNNATCSEVCDHFRKRFNCKCQGANGGSQCQFKACHDVNQKAPITEMFINGVGSFRVPCDLNTNGNGWTIFQRRIDGTENFFRGWDDYKNGFGTLSGEFWLGNKYLHVITSSINTMLRIDMEDFDGLQGYAEYSHFKIDSEEKNFTLSVSGFTGNVGDSFSSHNGQQFSTKDQDHDVDSSGSCALKYKGSWWYGACHRSNLNGLYLGGSHYQNAEGIEWSTWPGKVKYYYSLKRVEMKIRPISD